MKLYEDDISIDDGDDESTQLFFFGGNMAVSNNYKVPKSQRDTLERAIIQPGSITVAGFEGCDKLKQVVFPQTLIRIRENAFRDCTALEDINFEQCKRLTVIGQSAFEGCTSITELKTSDKSQLDIKKFAFKGCSNLTTVWLRPGIQSIDNGAFAECPNISEFYISASINEDQLMNISRIFGGKIPANCVFVARKQVAEILQTQPSIKKLHVVS